MIGIVNPSLKFIFLNAQSNGNNNVTYSSLGCSHDPVDPVEVMHLKY
jgi:hypothetical protein